MNDQGVVSLWTVNASGSSPTRILNDGSDVDRNPAYTPDGQRLIFFSDVGGHEAIWQVNPNGHGKKRLFQETPDPEDPTTGSGTENPAVSPNGRQFVYTAGGDLWTAAINGKNRTQLTKDGGDEADWARG
jgi:TolB protein